MANEEKPPSDAAGEVGVESDLLQLLAVGWSSLLVATLGVIAPMILGYVVIDEVKRQLASEQKARIPGERQLFLPTDDTKSFTSPLPLLADRTISTKSPRRSRLRSRAH